MRVHAAMQARGYDGELHFVQQWHWRLSDTLFVVGWTGFAVLTWSAAGAVFALWTFANLVPRADAIYHRYGEMFGNEFRRARLKRVIPFIY